MNLIKRFLVIVCIISLPVIFNSCDKKDDQQSDLKPQQETSPNKEKELQEKENFLNLREEQIKQREQRLNLIDSLGNKTGTTTKDTSKTSLKDKDITKEKSKDTTASITKKKDKKEKLKEKEKELNKRFDSPKSAIVDYLEFIKRGTTEGGNFDENMKKASDVWVSQSAEKFKKSYKNTKKFTVVSPPEIVSQKEGEASVKVKVKKTDTVSKGGKNKDEDTELTVTYNLVADKNGKWRIKNNITQKK